MFLAFDMFSDPSVPVTHVPALFAFRLNRFRILRYDPIHKEALVAAGKTHIMVMPEELAGLMRNLEWILEIPSFPVRLSPPRGRIAADADLSDLDFQDYLTLENLYQGYLSVKDDSLLKRMGAILYRRKFYSMGGLGRIHLFASFFWFASFKMWASTRWNNFLKPTGETVSLANPQSFLRDAVDAQIRALTKGDITKEKQILSMPCHRALTELDALARESAEYKAKLNKSK